MTRLLAFGDLHLGARRNHEREPGDGLRDQTTVLEHIARLAVEHQVVAVVNAGDTVEGPTLTPAEIVAYADFVSTLHEHDIPVVTLLGNGRHDLAMRDATALHAFERIPGVETFTVPGLRAVGDLTLCLLPWVHPGRLVAARGGGDRDEVHVDAAQLLLLAAADLRDAAPAGRKVLVLHGSIEGAGLPTGLPIDAHTSDVLPADELAGLGFDAIVAAHIHVPQAFHPHLGWTRSISAGCPTPPIFYTGSPLPLNFGEGGYEHGVWLLEVGETVEARFLPIESRRFVTIDMALDQPPDETVPAAWLDTDVDNAIVRVRITGPRAHVGQLDLNGLKQAILMNGAYNIASIHVEPEREQRARVDSIDEDIEPLAAVDLYAAATGLDAKDAHVLRELTAGYLDRLGAAA